MIRVTDLFCGCGGSSTGIAAVPGLELTHAINHDAMAVESHRANHPSVETVRCDLLDVHPAAFPRPDIVAGSPVCKEHTSAAGRRRKGIEAGQGEIFEEFDQCVLSDERRRNRATMWTMTQWAAVHRPAFVVVENVPGVVKWPPFERWLGEMRTLGYTCRIVSVNAMHVHGSGIDFIAPQTRDRVYIVCRRDGVPAPNLDICPLAYCERCGRDVEARQAFKRNRTTGIYGPRTGQYVYTCPEHPASLVEPYTHPAARAIDFTRPLRRVGDRVPSLAPDTLARLQKGMDRVGLRPFVVANRTHSVGRDVFTEPVHTLCTAPHLMLGVPSEMVGEGALLTMRGDRHFSPVDGVWPTQTTARQTALVGREPFIVTYNGNPTIRPVSDTLPAVTTVQRHGLAMGASERVEDLFYRMLDADECKVAMGFPADYVVLGGSDEQVKQVGNSNFPGIEQRLMSRIAEVLA